MPQLPPDAADPSAGETIVLPAHCTMATAADLHPRLVAAQRTGAPVEIDASGVDSVGQAVIQLLVAALMPGDDQPSPFAITNPSPAFVDRVAACRLSAQTGVQASEEPAL